MRRITDCRYDAQEELSSKVLNIQILLTCTTFPYICLTSAKDESYFMLFDSEDIYDPIYNLKMIMLLVLIWPN